MKKTTSIMDPEQRDAFFDQFLDPSKTLVRQEAPGQYLYVWNGKVERFNGELPVVGSRVKAKVNAEDIDLKAPGAGDSEWTFCDADGLCAAAISHKTWHGARALAAIALQAEPGELRLVESPL